MSKTDKIPSALILAGGYGTRLRSVVSDVPKVLAPLGGKPFMCWQLEWLDQQGVTDVILAVHYMAEHIIEFVENYENENMNIHLVRETEPLGTGGAVVNAFQTLNIENDVLVINGDTLFNFPLHPLLDCHQQQNATATMTVTSVGDAHRFGTVQIDGKKITGFVDASGQHEPGTVNCGAYILSPKIIKNAPKEAFSIEETLFPVLAKTGQLHSHVLDIDEAFVDVGIPETYLDMEKKLGAHAH